MAIPPSSSIRAHVPFGEIQNPQESEPKDSPLRPGKTQNSDLEQKISYRTRECLLTPETKTWERQISPKAKVLYHSNGTIIYSCFYTIITWEFNNEKLQASSFGSHNITALAESPTGELMIGNEIGDLWIGSELLDHKFPHSILEIIPIHKELYLIKTEKAIFVFNLATKTNLFEIKTYLKNIFVMGKNLLVALGHYELKIWRVDEKKNKVKELRYKDTPFSERCVNIFSEIKKISDTILLLSHQCGLYFVWDVTTRKYDEFSKFPSKSSILQLGKGSFAVGDANSGGKATQLVPFHKEYRQFSARRHASHLTLLSDGSILFADPGRSPSFIYIATKEGKKIFSHELPSMGSVVSLTELKDGSIAAELESSYTKMIVILKPRKKDDPGKLNSPSFKLGKHPKATSKKILTAQQDTSRKRKRLHIGDGTFDYTSAVIEKYKKSDPDLSRSITATELSPPSEQKTRDEVEALVKQGVNVFFGIDGQQIHQLFQGERFERIQWNFPHTEHPQETLPIFFRSASALQHPGDCIHVTLVQKASTENQKHSIWRQQENPIVKAATAAHYYLKGKRRFGPHRYPGYQHMKNSREPYFYSEGSEPREFVFEKIAPSDEETPVDLTRAEKLRDRSSKRYEIKTNEDSASAGLEKYYFSCSTDEDSSDY
ncbi:MAG: hypothetical protein K940chlam7_00005 [Chlamydiae bacterium]|nr:hypothetical protein [Chlamydiota bacterium]